MGLGRYQGQYVPNGTYAVVLTLEEIQLMGEEKAYQLPLCKSIEHLFFHKFLFTEKLSDFFFPILSRFNNFLLTQTQTYLLETDNINRSAPSRKLFCALTTAFTFAIRAGILPELGDTFGLSAEPAWLHPISIVVFRIPNLNDLGMALLYHKGRSRLIIMRKLHFVAHTPSILIDHFWLMDITTLLIFKPVYLVFGNGCTEAACNPMIADMYTGK